MLCAQKVGCSWLVYPVIGIPRIQTVHNAKHKHAAVCNYYTGKAAQYGMAEHGTAQHSMAQHGTAQHGTAQHGIKYCNR